MKILAFLIASLTALGACAPMTGDLAKDCAAMTQAVSAAQAAASVAGLVAERNPQSQTMQQAATLAAIAVTLADAQRARVCT